MRSKFPVAVHLFFQRGQEILFLRRYHTGYEDGSYSVVAGHVEAGESVTQAAAREALEEVGVSIHPDDLQVVHVMNRKSEDERIDFFVTVQKWEGEIDNHEPHKCDDLSWFSLEHLPENLIPYIRHALDCYQKGIPYSEFGWEGL